MRRSILGNTQIMSVSIIIFVVIAILVGISGSHMTKCIERETQALSNRTELRALGEQLASASDYLTEQAREYSLTGNEEYLFNYWNEVIYVRSREDAVEKLSSYSPPEKEQELLMNAKAYSDKLIETETISMKLMLLGNGTSHIEYSDDEKMNLFISIVENCELPQEYTELSDEEKREKSSDMLYNYFYVQSKTLIMTPIDEFQKAMNERLDNSVLEAENGMKTASFIQKMCSMMAIIFILMILLILEFYYIKPLKQYTRVLAEMDLNDMSKVRVVPKGSKELFGFGEVFNHLALVLENELEKTAHAERKMSEAKAQAEKANNAKSEFLAHMSHELRTPLNAITGCLYLMKNTPLNNEQQEYCHSIAISAENLLGLINDVLDISKIESGNMLFEKTDYDFYVLTDEVIRIIKIQADRKKILLKTDIDKNMPQYIKGDPLRMKQVLLNLLGNAVKFTDNGEVLLTVKIKEKLSDRIIAEFCVKDTGIGISPDSCKSIFEPFVQSDAGVTRKYGGTGLGLPIANMIVKNASSGDFSITAMPNKDVGTSFIFRAYIFTGEKTNDDTVKDKFTEINSNSSVLLVDDNEINLNIERKILCSFGLSVITASDGHKAVELAENNNFSIIFLDLHMPGIDGFETARRIRRSRNCTVTPIIALTADAVNGIEKKIHDAEMNGYLSKPFRSEKLYEMIAEYLDIAKVSPESLVTSSNMIFDPAECLHTLDNDRKYLTELITCFIQNHGRSCEYIIYHIRNGNYLNARKILHDIKGISGNLHCNKLCACSERLLKELHNNSADSLDRFVSAWNETLNELTNFINENSFASAEIKLDFDSVFGKFIEMCGNFDITASEIFYEHKELFRKNLERSAFDKLEKMVGTYSFQQIYHEFGRNKNV